MDDQPSREIQNGLADIERALESLVEAVTDEATESLAEMEDKLANLRHSIDSGELHIEAPEFGDLAVVLKKFEDRAERLEEIRRSLEDFS